MEAIGLVTWSSWLRPVVAVGSGAYAGAILPEAPRVGGPGSCLKLFLFLLCSLGLGEEQRGLGSIKPFRDDGFLQPPSPNDPVWRLRPPRCSCCRPFQPNVPFVFGAAEVLPPQRLMIVEVGAP